MENIIYKDIINKCKEYCNLIYQFEYYINQLYLNLNNQYVPHRGYLIDLKEYENFKNDINYQIYKTNINEYEINMIDKYVTDFSALNKTLEFKRFVQVEFNSYNELEQLLKENQYIFININLWNSLCKIGKEKDSFIYYYINNNICFKLKNNELVYFLPNNNIINFTTYILNQNNYINNNFNTFNNNINFQNYKQNNSIYNINNFNNNNNFQNHNQIKNIDDNIDFSDEKQNKNNQNNQTNNNILNLINIMKELFLFEKKLSDNSKNSDKEYVNSGYFINKISFDKWKENINYEKIKENYLEKYLVNDNSILTNEQNNEILNYITTLNNNFDINNNLNNFQLKSLNNLSEKEFESFTKTNSFVLFNKTLYKLINSENNINANEIEYKIKNNKISFEFGNLYFIFSIYNNIIFSNLDSNIFLFNQILCF